MPKKSATKPVDKPAPRLRPSLAHQVRIIGGNWKRTPLPVIEAGGLRPTPDRVRETVFNWLTHLIDGQWDKVHCLDLFAGTGALGLEAASRGAARVLLVEDNSAVAHQLEAIRDRLKAPQVSVLRADARSLDPPYHAGWLAQMLPLIIDLLAPAGLVYVEAECSLEIAPPPAWMVGWQVVRADRAGLVYYHLLQRRIVPQIQA
jgi:16S rRNA (guanine966-N2)-methyltransferase